MVSIDTPGAPLTVGDNILLPIFGAKAKQVVRWIYNTQHTLRGLDGLQRLILIDGNATEVGNDRVLTATERSI